MNLKQKQFLKLIILVFSLSFFIINNIFSQSLSFDELIKLQKEPKNNVSEFLKVKKWQLNTALDYLWEYNDSLFSTAYNPLFVYRGFNCNKAILYYKFNDSLLFNELKNDAGKLSLSNKKINYPDNSIITDFCLINLFVRFYETYGINELAYSCWIFAKEDAWYFGEINKFCFQKIEIDKSEKAISIDWYYNPTNDEKAIVLYTILSDTTRNISPPEFPGGDAERIKFMESNINLPVKARRNKNMYDGKYHTSFYVEKDGSITFNMNSYHDDWGYKVEVQNAIKKMPRWIPATENNKPIRVELKMEVFFKNNEKTQYFGKDYYAPVIRR